MPPGQKIVQEAFAAFDAWCRKYREAHPDCELSVLELAELYGVDSCHWEKPR
jgi:hypothetical protein